MPTNDLLKHNFASHSEKPNSLKTIRQDWLSCSATEQDLVSYWILLYLPPDCNEVLFSLVF